MIGRRMQNALINLNIENEFKEALMKIGYNLEQIYDEEVFLPFLLIFGRILAKCLAIIFVFPRLLYTELTAFSIGYMPSSLPVQHHKNKYTFESMGMC